jgi:hypothetical protein
VKAKRRAVDMSIHREFHPTPNALDHLNGFGMYASMYFIFLSLLSIPATPVDGEISRDALRSGLAKDREES